MLESDPGLSMRLLRLVNSAGYALRVRCTSVRHAASLVGMRRLHQLATTAAVLDLFETDNLRSRRCSGTRQWSVRSAATWRCTSISHRTSCHVRLLARHRQADADRRRGRAVPRPRAPGGRVRRRAARARAAAFRLRSRRARRPRPQELAHPEPGAARGRVAPQRRARVPVRPRDGRHGADVASRGPAQLPRAHEPGADGIVLAGRARPRVTWAFRKRSSRACGPTSRA